MSIIVSCYIKLKKYEVWNKELALQKGVFCDSLMWIDTKRVYKTYH